MIKPPPNVLELPLEERAEMALEAGGEESAREGRAIYVWRDGAVVEVSVEELRERAARIIAD